MTYDFDAGDIDISTVDAITVTFRATVVANGCCDNSGGIDLVINWGSDYTWVRVEPYGHDYSTGDYYGDVEATIVWRREPGNVFDFKVAESSFVYSGADVSIAETYSDINESDIDLAAMKVVMGAACGQGCYDQAQGLEYVIHSFTITQLKVCFEVTEAP
jgi:hypothetical protein